jgi:hypothetical protein
MDTQHDSQNCDQHDALPIKFPDSLEHDESLKKLDILPENGVQRTQSEIDPELELQNLRNMIQVYDSLHNKYELILNQTTEKQREITSLQEKLFAEKNKQDLFYQENQLEITTHLENIANQKKAIAEKKSVIHFKCINTLKRIIHALEKINKPDTAKHITTQIHEIQSLCESLLGKINPVIAESQM